MTFQHNDNLNDLIQQAGRSAGVNPNQLKQAVDSGKLVQPAAGAADAEYAAGQTVNPPVYEGSITAPDIRKPTGSAGRKGGNILWRIWPRN